MFSSWITVSVIPFHSKKETQYHKGAGCGRGNLSVVTGCSCVVMQNALTCPHGDNLLCRSVKGCLPAAAMGTSPGSNRRPVWEDIKEWEHPGQNPKPGHSCFFYNANNTGFVWREAAEAPSIPAHRSPSAAPHITRPAGSVCARSFVNTLKALIILEWQQKWQ